MKFRKLPIVVDAVPSAAGELIATREGTMRADPGDWIITGVQGERYPCKPDIFATTYEPVPDAEQPAGELTDAAIERASIARCAFCGAAAPLGSLHLCDPDPFADEKHTRAGKLTNGEIDTAIERLRPRDPTKLARAIARHFFELGTRANNNGAQPPGSAPVALADYRPVDEREIIARLNVAAAEYLRATRDDSLMPDIGFAHGHLFSWAAAVIAALVNNVERIDEILAGERP